MEMTLLSVWALLDMHINTLMEQRVMGRKPKVIVIIESSKNKNKVV